MTQGAFWLSSSFMFLYTLWMIFADWGLQYYSQWRYLNAGMLYFVYAVYSPITYPPRMILLTQSAAWKDLNIKSVVDSGKEWMVNGYRQVKRSTHFWKSHLSCNKDLDGLTCQTYQQVSEVVSYLSIHVHTNNVICTSGSVKLHAKQKCSTLCWKESLDLYWTDSDTWNNHGEQHTSWSCCLYVISQLQDVCKQGSWVFAKHTAEDVCNLLLSNIWSLMPFSLNRLHL